MAEQGIINTFNKGLQQDIDFILQPDGTYRNMKNGMLISKDGHHYTLELADGNRVILNLLPRHINHGTTSLDRVPMAIGFSSFIDKLVVFSTNNESDTGGYGEIGILTFKKTDNDFVAQYIPYYHHKDLKFSKMHRIESFSFKENDAIERCYFTDNNNEPRVFNFANPIFTNYIASGSLVIGKKYMVVRGVIRQPIGGTYYGPSVNDGTGDVMGNVFTATSAATYSNTSGNALVIEYYPLELLDWVPSRLLGSIQFSGYSSGNVDCGSKIYFYRLKNTTEGVYTSWSYPSAPIQVDTSNFFSAQTPHGNNYHNVAGAGSTVSIINSGHAVYVSIDNIDTNFDVIELCCMEFDQLISVPYKTSIVNRATVTGSTMVIPHTGTTNLGTVSLNDLTLFPASILKVKTLTTDKNYNLIANITERKEFDMDLSAVTVSQIEYPLICHGEIQNLVSNHPVCSNNLTYDPHPPVIGVSPGVNDIQPWSRWVVSGCPVRGAVGNSVQYPFGTANYYYDGDVITGVVTAGAVPNVINNKATYNGTAKLRPCTTKNRYTVSNPLLSTVGLRVENAIELNTAFWDYKDPAVASHNRGYWSSEKYRLGLLFYDKKGNPFYTKWLSDYTFNKAYTKGLIKSGLGSETIYALNPSGLNISNLSIPASIMSQISGFSIVRAERDPRIVNQGLVWQTVLDGGIANQLKPMSGVLKADDSGVVDNTLFIYMCPDWLTSTPTKSLMGDIGDSLEEAQFLQATNFNAWAGGNSYIIADSYDAGKRNAITKLMTASGADASSPRNIPLNKFDGNTFMGISESGATITLSSLGKTYLNIMTTSVGALVYDYCVTTVNGTSSPFASKNMMGCMHLIVNPGGTLLGRDITHTYALGIDEYKIVMNYVKNVDINMLYGGLSADAKANTLYITTGHYQPITDQVKLDTLQNDGSYLFNNIEVFGGDCYLNLVDQVYGLENVVTFGGSYAAHTLFYPCESTTNYNLRNGRTASRQGVRPSSLYAGGVTWNSGGIPNVIQLEGYSYNQGYSTEGQIIKYPALPTGNKFSSKFPYRARFAGLKYSGESIDSFRKFLIADYKDLEPRFGDINNIRSKNGRVLVFQNKGISSVPVLERQLLSSTGGAATTVGTGGVIDRFDPITSFYGNQHQFGLTETEYGYIWFDMRNRALCIISTGGEIQEISLIKGLQVFFNGQFDQGDNGLYPYGIYNTDNVNTPEIPLMGYGITGVYDPKFKMSYLTFKYDYAEFEGVIPSPAGPRIAKDFTIGYSHSLNAIIGFYDWIPAIMHNHNDLVLSVNNSKNYAYYGIAMPPTSYVVGDIIKVTDSVNIVNEGEYICISPVSISSYPPPVITTDPLFVGSIYWLKINDQSQIYIQTFGAEYCKFYGKVYDHELEVIVNPRVDGAFSVMRIQQKSNDVNYTSIYCNNDNQSAQDVLISATDRNYKYIDKSWFSSLPLGKTGRMTDHYLKIKFVLKGYVTNPTVAINKNKVFQFLKSFFVMKK